MERWEGVGDFQGQCYASSVSNPNWLRHCRNEVLAAVLTPTGGNGSGIVVTAVQRFSLNPSSGQFGYTGLGSPSVVCDPVTSGLQCEVYVINWSQFKEIKNWRICVNTSGFCGYSLPYSERANSPGETDFPIALSQRRPNGNGRVMEVVTGGDLNLYWRSKASVADSFGSWNGISGTVIGPPSVRRSNVVDTYTLAHPKL